MRYLGLLFALSLIVSPAQARKHQKHATAQRSMTPPPAEPAEPPPQIETRRAAPPPSAQVAQADDEEVPGKRHKK